MKKMVSCFSLFLSITLFFAALPLTASDQHQHEGVTYNNCQIFNQYNFMPLPALRYYNTPDPLQASKEPGEKQEARQYLPRVSDRGKPYHSGLHYRPESEGRPYQGKLERQIPYTKEMHRCTVGACKLSYSRRSDLVGHIQLLHPDYSRDNKVYAGKYVCPVKDCPAKFTRRKILNRHIKRFHNSEIQIAEILSEREDGEGQNACGGQEVSQAPREEEGSGNHAKGVVKDRHEHYDGEKKNFSISFICND